MYFGFFTPKLKTCFLLLLLIATSARIFSQDELAGLTSNGGPEGGGTAFRINTNGSGFGLTKTFANWGGNSLSALVRGTDGNFYGVTSEGGTYGHGTIFRVSTSGTVTILKHLNMTVDGGYPKGTLLLAKDGNFYGTVTSGTVNNGGGIFKISPSGTYTIVRSLSINTDGGRPNGKLIQATDGNFYGVNYAGGTYGYGTIFKLTTAGVYTVLRAFNYKPDGGNSYGSVMQARDGNLYGMTYWGGNNNSGTIFKITTAGVYTVLRHLASATDGAYPRGDLIQATDGHLYGLISSGGLNYNGTAFRITTAGAFTVLKALSASVEGGNPSGSLIQGTDGFLYGLAANMSGGFTGSVFRMTTSGSTLVMKKFTLATDGGYPAGSLFQNTDGALYGMTTQGGQNFTGTIFKITTASVFTVLSHFNGAHHGYAPQEQLVAGRDSALYGMTNRGGLYNFGTIFKMCGGTTTVLRHLNKTTDGANPAGSLIQASDGNLYGMTYTGGTNGQGTIFRVTRAGVFTVLRHLKATTDGGNPLGTLTQGSDGFLYGMNSAGGTGNSGTIFKISTAGVYTVLRNLVLSTDGGNPEGGLVQARDGAFYGITSYNSRFFKITSAGVFTVLSTFNSATQGTGFSGSLIQGAGTDNNFYGAMNSSGTAYSGTIVKIAPTGAITVLRQLTATTDGSYPRGNLVRGTDGNYYGVNSAGGTNKAGTIFRISSAGAFTVLRHLNINTDGTAPTGGLVLTPKRNIIATPQANIAVTEDVAKAVVLAGTGSTALVYNIAANPRNGTLTGTGRNRTYTPNRDYVGRDSFAFTVGVGCMVSNPAYVSFNVTGVNDAPVLATIGNKTVKRSSLLTFTAAATDPDAGQIKTFSLITPPAGASINSGTGVFSWTPSTAGTFSVKVRITDNGSPVLYDEETITVTVTATLALASTLEEENTSFKYSSSIGVYPNPAERFVTVTLAEDFEKISTAVLDIRGGVLIQNKHRITGSNKVQVDLGAILAGEYIIRTDTEKGTKIFKVIKK
jgi:uncharacterized repeat protein (TIGR03803 family)